MIVALSANYGFVPWNMLISDYNARITKDLKDALGREYFSNLVTEAETVLLAGSHVYRKVMLNMVPLHQWDKVVETTGLGIGDHRMVMGRWLRQHFGTE